MDDGADAPKKFRGTTFCFSPEVAQYLSIRYSERLADAGIEASVGSKDDSYDNALAETINSLYKAEVIYRQGPWKSREAVELARLTWVDWFNKRRLLEPLGYVPPAEFESAHYEKQRIQPWWSDSTETASGISGVI